MIRFEALFGYGILHYVDDLSLYKYMPDLKAEFRMPKPIVKPQKYVRHTST